MKESLKRIPTLYNLVHRVRHFGYRVRSMPRSLQHHYRCYRFSRMVKTSSPLRIVIGAAGVFGDGWIPSDIQYLNLLRSEHWSRFFSRNSIDALLAEHVWDILKTDEGLHAARQCFQYLKPGGYLRVAVPDGYHPDPAYIEWVKVGGGGPADDHKVLYNHKSLKRLFEEAGFRVELLEYFDEYGRFHYREWDEGSGKICRSKRFDQRNKDGRLNYTSVILDAHKISGSS